MKTSSTVTTGHKGLGDSHIYRLVLISLFTALSHVVFTLLQIKITFPGGDATSIYLGNAVCVPGALILGGFYGGLSRALGMTIEDLFDPIYVVYAPKTFLLKLYIGLTTGPVAHKIGRISESSDKRYVFRFVVAVFVCDLPLNVILGPLVGYFYKLATLGKPAADLVLVQNVASISINAATSAAAAVVIYMPLRSILVRFRLFDRFRRQEI